MTDEPPPLVELFDRLRFILAEPLDFSRTDTRSTVAKVRLLVAAATYFNALAVADFGGRIGSARGPGLVEQVVGSAFQTFGGEDPHPAPFDKAAMLLRGITQGHPFTDGNKRTGFLVASYYLTLSGWPAPPALSVSDVVELCMRVSAGTLRDVGSIAAELERIWSESG